MKELDSFTVERLEKWINTPEKYDHRYSPRINCDELRALARIALAAKRAEPVAYITYKGHLIHAADPKLSEYSDPQPLYDAPQLNSQVPLGSWIKCSDQMPEKDGHYIGWGTYYDGDEYCYIPVYYWAKHKRWDPIEDDCNPDKVTITLWAQLPVEPGDTL